MSRSTLQRLALALVSTALLLLVAGAAGADEVTVTQTTDNKGRQKVQITGDPDGNNIRITRNADGTLTVEGRDGTTVRGNATFAAPNELEVELGGGSDTIEVDGVGLNELRIKDEIDRPGDAGTDRETVTIKNSSVRRLVIRTGQGDDQVTVENSNIERGNFDSPGGSDTVNGRRTAGTRTDLNMRASTEQRSQPTQGAMYERRMPKSLAFSLKGGAGGSYQQQSGSVAGPVAGRTYDQIDYSTAVFQLAGEATFDPCGTLPGGPRPFVHAGTFLPLERNNWIARGGIPGQTGIGELGTVSRANVYGGVGLAFDLPVGDLGAEARASVNYVAQVVKVKARLDETLFVGARFEEEEKQAFHGIGFGTGVDVPLLRKGRLGISWYADAFFNVFPGNQHASANVRGVGGAVDVRYQQDTFSVNGGTGFRVFWAQGLEQGLELRY